jgi:hypothetical protein
MTLEKRYRDLLGLLVAAGAGGMQIAVFLPDRAPGDMLWPLAAVSLLAGLPLGFWLPRAWPLVCPLASWGSLLVGTLVLRAGRPSGVSVIVVSIAAVLLGGVAGAVGRHLATARCGPLVGSSRS